MSKCFLVTGAESTGTRMMVRSFVLLNIPELEFPRRFNWAYGSIFPIEGDCVIHVGMPMGGVWADLWEVAKRMRNEGKKIVPIVMTREWFATTQSQVKRGFVSTPDEAIANIREAYRRITQQLPHYFMVSYEQYCLEAQYRSWLFSLWGLPLPPIDIHYGNAQYYG